MIELDKYHVLGRLHDFNKYLTALADCEEFDEAEYADLFNLLQAVANFRSRLVTKEDVRDIF